MNFKDYVPEALKTAVFTHNFYPFASLMVETNELADLFVKPWLRGDNGGQINLGAVKKEMGDCYWNLAVCAYDCSVAGDIEKLVGEDHHNFGISDDRYHVIFELQFLASLVALRGTYQMYDRPLAIFISDFAGYIRRLRQIQDMLGITESEVLEANLAKLRDRAARGVLKGDGGDR